jgi:predicted O-methyltransferase YrrM
MSEYLDVRPGQDATEIEQLSDLLRSENVRSYLEIGSKFGGSLWAIGSVLEPPARIVSVDLPGGTVKWQSSSVSLNACADALRGMGHQVSVILGDSTDEAVIAQVAAMSPFDAMFIDANHTLPYVTADFRNYSPMARIIAFHDISWHRQREWKGVRIDAPQFWESIKNDYRHQEFKYCPTGKNNGIGVIWRE